MEKPNEGLGLSFLAKLCKRDRQNDSPPPAEFQQLRSLLAESSKSLPQPLSNLSLSMPFLSQQQQEPPLQSLRPHSQLPALPSFQLGQPERQAEPHFLSGFKVPEQPSELKQFMQPARKLLKVGSIFQPAEPDSMPTQGQAFTPMHTQPSSPIMFPFLNPGLAPALNPRFTSQFPQGLKRSQSPSATPSSKRKSRASKGASQMSPAITAALTAAIQAAMKATGNNKMGVADNTGQKVAGTAVMNKALAAAMKAFSKVVGSQSCNSAMRKGKRRETNRVMSQLARPNIGIVNGTVVIKQEGEDASGDRGGGFPSAIWPSLPQGERVCGVDSDIRNGDQLGSSSERKPEGNKDVGEGNCADDKPFNIRISYSLEQKKKVWTLLQRNTIDRVYELVRQKIPRSTLRKWTKMMASGHSAERKSGSGRKPHHPELEDHLYQWFLEKRKKLLPVTMADLQNEGLRKAKELKIDGAFKASKGWAHNFQRRHSLTNRHHTRMASKTTAEMAPPMRAFFEKVNLEMLHHDPADVWNFDEVRIYFEPNIPHTVERIGEKHVSILTVKAQCMRMTVVLMISAAGVMAPPVLLYYNKRFEPFTVPEHPDALIISNSSAYNIECTHYSQILPHVLKYVREGGLVIFDECNAHFSPRIEQLFIARKVKYLCIPGGATCLLQPVDCGIGKIVKREVKKRFIQWCNDNYEKITTPDSRRKRNFMKPTNRDIAEWVLHGARSVSTDAIRNSFVHTGIISKEMQRKILDEKLPQYFVHKEPSPPVKLGDPTSDPNVITKAEANQGEPPVPAPSSGLSATQGTGNKQPPFNMMPPGRKRRGRRPKGWLPCPPQKTETYQAIPADVNAAIKTPEIQTEEQKLQPATNVPIHDVDPTEQSKGDSMNSNPLLSPISTPGFRVERLRPPNNDAVFEAN